jgi:hypothetical protein
MEHAEIERTYADVTTKLVTSLSLSLCGLFIALELVG